MLLALGFGSGLLPRAPGTFGTMAAVPVYLLFVWPDSPLFYWLATLMVIALGVPICSIATRRLGVDDDPAIVWDEIAGFLVTLAFVPLSVLNIVTGFVLFRFFDIWKPWPIRRLDRSIHGGWGIMLDDLLAGVFAAILMVLLNRYLA